MGLMASVYRLAGRVWVPPELMHDSEPCILHISDTPTPFFSALPGLIRHVKPTWIIHTGDLVDDVKLALVPACIGHYTAQVQRLIRILEASEAEAVFLCLGNHDDQAAVAAVCGRAQIITGGQRLPWGEDSIGAAHYAADAQETGAGICIFGHDLTRRTDLSGMPRLLNGLEAIHIIYPDSGRIYRLPYPAGTDDQRLGRGKIGL